MLPSLWRKIVPHETTYSLRCAKERLKTDSSWAFISEAVFALHRRGIATVLPCENNLSFMFCYFSMLWNMFVALTTHKIQKLSIHQFFYHGLSCSQGAEAFSSCFRVKSWLHLWICHQPFAHTGPNRETSNTFHTHLQSYWPAKCRCSCLDTGRKCKPHTQPWVSPLLHPRLCAVCTQAFKVRRAICLTESWWVEVFTG